MAGQKEWATTLYLTREGAQIHARRGPFGGGSPGLSSYHVKDFVSEPAYDDAEGWIRVTTSAAWGSKESVPLSEHVHHCNKVIDSVGGKNVVEAIPKRRGLHL